MSGYIFFSCHLSDLVTKVYNYTTVYVIKESQSTYFSLLDVDYRTSTHIGCQVQRVLFQGLSFGSMDHPS